MWSHFWKTEKYPNQRLQKQIGEAQTFWLTGMCGDVTIGDDNMVYIITRAHLSSLHKGLQTLGSCMSHCTFGHGYCDGRVFA